jgi:glutathione S-transferase
MKQKYTLISHKLCPYVQRVAIVLMEKGCEYELINIDLANKPEWFLNLSPLGKTPVLLIDDEPLFESAVICEFLDETILPRLHPTSPLTRAKHKGWIEFASATLNVIAALYNAVDEQTLQARAEELRQKFLQIEPVLSDGSYFHGNNFSLVDAAFAPVFRYFEVIDEIIGIDFFSSTPKIRLWRNALRERESVKAAVSTDYLQALKHFFAKRGSALSQRICVRERSESEPQCALY